MSLLSRLFSVLLVVYGASAQSFPLATDRNATDAAMGLFVGQTSLSCALLYPAAGSLALCIANASLIQHCTPTLDPAWPSYSQLQLTSTNNAFSTFDWGTPTARALVVYAVMQLAESTSFCQAESSVPSATQFGVYWTVLKQWQKDTQCSAVPIHCWDQAMSEFEWQLHTDLQTLAQTLIPTPDPVAPPPCEEMGPSLEICVSPLSTHVIECPGVRECLTIGPSGGTQIMCECV